MPINNTINYVKQLELLALKHLRHKFGDLKALSNLKEKTHQSLMISAPEKHLLEGFFKSQNATIQMSCFEGMWFLIK